MRYVLRMFAPLSEIFNPIWAKNEGTRAIFKSECSGVTVHSNVGTRRCRRCEHAIMPIFFVCDDTEDADDTNNANARIGVSRFDKFLILEKEIQK